MDAVNTGQRRLPMDVVLVIVDELAACHEWTSLTDLARTARSFHELITPTFYRDVCLKDDAMALSFDLTVTYNGHLGTLVRTLCFPTPSTWKWPRTLIKYPGIVTLRLGMIDDMSSCLDGLVNLRRLFLHETHFGDPAALLRGPTGARLHELHIHLMDLTLISDPPAFAAAIRTLVQLEHFSATVFTRTIHFSWTHELLLPQLMSLLTLRRARFLICGPEKELRDSRFVELARQEPRITLAILNDIRALDKLDIIHAPNLQSLWASGNPLST